MTAAYEPETAEPQDEAPERTCAGCREHAERAALLRYAHVPGHQPVIVPDFFNRLGGRGVWVHPHGGCLKRAVRGGFARSLRGQVELDLADLREQARGQLERRLSGLLLAAQRRRALALGTDATRLAVAACKAHLLLVAKDAAGRRDDIVAFATERSVQVTELSTKEELGRLTGKDSLALLAVLDRQIAREISDSARWLAGLSEDG
ncbi:MAG: putative nucleic-acid-binding protein [Myxococcaceae bacterium]|nr:putative nucleic-acid-binding protein [Myxococcaceae bacterium]